MQNGFIVLSSSLFLLLASCQESSAHAGSGRTGAGVECARAVLVPISGSGASGEVLFEETADGVRIRGRVEGLEPGKHGFHVHQYGDLTDRETGASAGGHFAPEGNAHGHPSADERHVGDLGNIVADENGVATIDMVDDGIALGGPHSIVGRGLVVHAGEDRFTQPSGEAGARVAFSVIGIAAPDSGGADRGE